MTEKKSDIRLNPEQEEAVRRIANTVVAAGAGSGKTSVLAGRYAYLVTAAGLSVDRILTLTFTRKAAAEMYRRIYGTLARIAAGEPGPEQERARRAVGEFFRARIQTLDSYSASLVKQGAARYGIAPDFSIDDERCRSLAEKSALPFLVARREHPAIKQLYAQKKPQNIAADLFAKTVFTFSAIDDPPDYAKETEKQFSLAVNEWEKMAFLIGGKLEELIGIIEDGDGGDGFIALLAPLAGQYQSGDIPFPSPRDLEFYFSTISAAPGEECVRASETHPLRAEISQCLVFFHNLAWINIQKGKRGSRAKEIINELREEFSVFSSLAVFFVQGGIILSLARLLNEFQVTFLAEKRREKILSFNDTARLARTILRDHHDIRQGEKETFEAVMIDEFQDNNDLQKELLFLLAEKNDRLAPGVPGADDIAPEKLFFVGDEKQSIYRFRGADVAVFRKLKEELAGGSLSLKTNYRSSPELIGAFNALFGGSAFDPSGESAPGEFPGIFAPENPDGPGNFPLWEAAYSPLGADPGKSLDTGKKEIPFRVCIFDASGSVEENGETAEPPGAVENEAFFVAEKIATLLSAKKYRPGDIAVLFRSRSSQNYFEKHLNLRGIPYSAEGITGFFFDAPANDMLALLRLAAYPLDTEAYAVTLRSPFAGLSLNGLAVCITLCNQAKEQGTSSSGGDIPFPEEALPLLGDEDREPFINGQRLYRKICGLAKTETIASLVSRLWYDEGYRYETGWHPRTASFRELYDYLFAWAVQADQAGMSLAGFTDSMLRKRDGGEALEEKDIPLERSGAVRLLTIHKSKGLEFPVVFLTGAGRKSRNNGVDGDVYRTSDGGLALRPPLPQEWRGLEKVRRNFFYEQTLAEERGKRTAELRRLLYVAMTRAEEELYISGHLSLGHFDNPTTTENLPERIAAFVNGKREKNAGTEGIPGDSIIDDDTLFGLLLPALVSRLQGKTAAPLFFSLENIPAHTEEEIRGEGGRSFRNDRDALTRFIAAAAPLYEKTPSLSTPVLPLPYRSPSSFAGEFRPSAESPEAASGSDPLKIDREYSGEDGADLFAEVDAILARHGENGSDRETFTAADFGTVAHSCVESLLAGREPSLPANSGGGLGLKESDTVLKAGAAIAERFLRSPLGKKALAAAWRKSEYAFRSLLKPPGGERIVINGIMDLLFEDSDTVYVVDFKTDSHENPAEHIPQTGFYHLAAAELRGRPCRVWLYYLRSGRAIEMTQAAQQYASGYR